MITHIIEATNSTQYNHGKFLLMRFDSEFGYQSQMHEFPLLPSCGWTADCLWVCPMFEPFLEWLYRQDLTDIRKLPPLITLPPDADKHCSLSGYRRPGE